MNTLQKKEYLVNKLKKALSKIESDSTFELSEVYYDLFQLGNVLDKLVSILAEKKHPNFFCQDHKEERIAIYREPNIVCQSCYEEAIRAHMSGTDTEEQHHYYTTKVLG